jgi:anti-sigma regulatory factor (Ser/Thr protein kinase)
MLAVLGRRVQKFCPSREAGERTRTDGSESISPTHTSAWFDNVRDRQRNAGPPSVSGRHWSSGGAGDSLTVRLRGGPEAAAEARAALARLRADLERPLTETLRLLVTELVANSVRHASARHVGLKALVGDRGVWIEVTDEGPGFDPREHDHTASDESGWGLFLVERLADRWGVRREGNSTRVWFELRRA